jgi:Protein of unknown function (DUF3147)
VRLKVQAKSLRETTATEYATRFVFGGLVTVAATLIANRWGPVIGGIFLAFPGIFPAGISLVEKHKTKREAREGKIGVLSARGEASVEAAGASAGAVGLVAFALVVWKSTTSHALVVMLGCAALAWAVVSWAAWMAREKHSAIAR